MIKRTLNLIGLLLLLTKPTLASIYVEQITEDDFFDVKENIILAIQGQGLVIAHHSDVSTMLHRTATDLMQNAFNTVRNMMPMNITRYKRLTKMTYKHGVVIEFCSASISAETTQADPNNILFCPFSIAIFQLSDEPNQVHVSYLHLSQFADAKNTASVQALTKVENMLAEIVTEALE
ncbi:hypothetical protein MNB_SUP05-SYMBIONT-4-506 [hydrothermal vent metagenome]|uniref:DUF302 domain-containing protein n=1 Tax=hydrothermal vent metagenome TaxID=652676 RepID=A0A1W1DZR9_9ZZZZ